MEVIFDKIRGTYLKATPEEIVRQSIISWLESNGIIPSLIGREVVLDVSNRSLRADIVVFSKQMLPYFIIECKAADVKLTEKTLLQVFQYNKVLSCKYVMITNGKNSLLYRRDENGHFAGTNDVSEVFHGH